MQRHKYKDGSRLLSRNHVGETSLKQGGGAVREKIPSELCTKQDYFSKNEGKVKIFSDTQTLKYFIISRSYL